MHWIILIENKKLIYNKRVDILRLSKKEDPSV
jgi:hypothetical protein